MINVEQPGLLEFNPAGLFNALALGAMTIATRGVLHDDATTLITARHEAAKRGGSALNQGIGDLTARRGQPLEVPATAQARANNVSDLQRRFFTRRWSTIAMHVSGVFIAV